MNEQEFNQRVMVYSGKFYSYSYKLLGNHDDACDVVQDLYCKLWRIKHNLNKIINIEAYATTMVRNLCLDRLKLKKRNLINFESINDLQGIDDKMLNQDVGDQELKLNKVRNAMVQLPDIQQKIFIMRDIDEMEFEAIAKTLNITPENCRVILSRARQKIREILVEKNEK